MSPLGWEDSKRKRNRLSAAELAVKKKKGCVICGKKEPLEEARMKPLRYGGIQMGLDFKW